MAKALKIQQTSEMLDFFKEGVQNIRMGYYPPCPQPDKVIGLNPHSDGSGLTILLQVNDIQGLQVKKDGLWIPIAPLPNAFVFNVGDQLEVTHKIIHQSFYYMCFFFYIDKQKSHYKLTHIS
jgi:isopenicillin N synthase-like dioxygenase